MDVIVSPRAIADLAEIAKYIAQDNPERARSFVDELREACRTLADFPRRFPLFPPAGDDARYRGYGAYLIVYTVTDVVNILTIIHGARDIDPLF